MTKRTHLTPDDWCLPLKKRRNLGQGQGLHDVAHAASFIVAEPPRTPDFVFSPISPRAPATYFFRPWCSPETLVPAIPNHAVLWPERIQSGDFGVNSAPCMSESLVADTNDSGISESSADSSLEGSPLQTPVDAVFSPHVGDVSYREDPRSDAPPFASRTPLSVHGESRFDCEDCGRKFKKRAYLVRHQRLHTGETPYACPSCPAAFITWDKLNRHKMIDHQ
ncbi:zinc finger protein 467-like [Penaeus monodon]|uniref:zinc finger protein 467-like n=1 Tax=Penaeus monodon TaxID=6687 RepID=UPI0018A775F5|nr:zinc finger protein 467-like [Penaeus monodon]